jgi:hypothetical protein
MINVLRGHSIGHSKQKTLLLYVHVFYSERFPRQSYFTVQCTVHCTEEQHAMPLYESQSSLILAGELSKLYYSR